MNIGPFYVDTDRDAGAAREALVQLEQLRWVVGNLLETQDLPSLWPIRIVLTGERAAERSVELAGAGRQPSFFRLLNGQYLYVAPHGRPLPLGEVAGILLDANTPRLPESVESGVRQLFATLQAHGSRVTWGGQPPQPDLDWARIQLFATKFEYGASFHIFLTALKGGSTFAAAERDAFGKNSGELEAEARANLASGHWTPVAVSGRPLDPKRDFGEHSLDAVTAAVYLADWNLPSDRQGAEAAYKAAVEGGAPALGYAGLAELSKLSGADAKAELDDAVRAGSHDATVYVAAAAGLPESEALPLLKRAAQLNERWAEPVYQQVQFGTTPGEKEGLLKKALKLDPRATSYWIELARLETTAGEGTAAQGAWLRAEDAAATEAERSHVHELRMASEQERLDAAEAARLRDRNAVHLADEQAQEAEADRIRAAEQKANQANDQAAGEQKAADAAVPWDSLVGESKVSGVLTRVDCLEDGWRLWVKTRAGAATQLFASRDLNVALSCGVQPVGRRIQAQYRATPDEARHTAGTVTSFELR